MGMPSTHRIQPLCKMKPRCYLAFLNQSLQSLELLTSCLSHLGEEKKECFLFFLWKGLGPSFSWNFLSLSCHVSSVASALMKVILVLRENWHFLPGSAEYWAWQCCTACTLGNGGFNVSAHAHLWDCWISLRRTIKLNSANLVSYLAS